MDIGKAYKRHWTATKTVPLPEFQEETRSHDEPASFSEDRTADGVDFTVDATHRFKYVNKNDS